ncbi:SMP-30/gluconolactonase/LRE family protein [Tenacibaculum mesophilum]|uniref:SMP-30/gluconolactonase/LRE family protein n=1 Tax=Tenacibaculum mesophilum TaxID=104268 RepID=UPI002493CBB6|nr:L-dopachrome tautomerase-related protein [Tenacibaculum mesophilum]
MKKILILSLSIFSLITCKNETKRETKKPENKQSISENKSNITEIASFKGQQVTGVTVTQDGRVFANFPRWRDSVKYSVVEVFKNGSYKPYPNEVWNLWQLGKHPKEDQFLAVQSVVAFEDKLYILDTRNPKFNGVVDAPRVFMFNLNTNILEQMYKLEKDSYHTDSYINDLRVDKTNNKLYLTDSNHAGLVALDLNTGKSTRILDNHKSTMAEVSELTFDNTVWKNVVHSDGIAFDQKNQRLFYHALSGYSLYSIPVNSFNLKDKSKIEASVKFEAKTSAPDGMIFDQKGNLYYGDLEHNKINYITPNGTIKTLIEGEKVKWADTFSIYDGDLYYTNSRINEASGDISNLNFTINKIALPK